MGQIVDQELNTTHLIGFNETRICETQFCPITLCMTTMTCLHSVNSATSLLLFSHCITPKTTSQFVLEWQCVIWWDCPRMIIITRWVYYTSERTIDVFALVTASPIIQHWPLSCRPRIQALAGWTWFSWNRLGLWCPGIGVSYWFCTHTWAWSKAMGCPWTLGSNQPAPRCLNTPCTLCNLWDRNHLGCSRVVQQTK